MKEKFCKDCGKGLKEYRSARCRSCASKNYLRKHPEKLLGKNNPNYKTGDWTDGKIGYKCQDCGKPVFRKETKRCVACFGKWSSGKYKITKRFDSEKNPSWKGGKPRCIDCGVIIKSYVGKRCVECIKKFQQGENSSNWKGGKTEREDPRKTDKYKKWRMRIFTRDNFACAICEQRGAIYLEAHHIENYYKYPKLRFSIHNGITLCRSCHRFFHKINRRKVVCFKSDITGRYLSGESVAQIANDERCLPMDVRKELQWQGIKIRNAGFYARMKYRTDIVKRYLNGETARKIAETEGCHYRTILSFMRKRGFRRGKRKR
jgi:hypothetical protein